MDRYHLAGVQPQASGISAQETFYVEWWQVQVAVFLQSPEDRFPYPCSLSHFLQRELLGDLAVFKEVVPALPAKK